MGGQVAGSGGAGGKAANTTNNTGAPAWTSGATGNSMMAPQAQTQPATGGAPGGMTTAPQNPAEISSGAASPSSPAMQGNWWEPGSDSYNQMNNLLTTQPMGNLVNILQSGGLGTAGNQVLQNLLGTSGSNDWMNQAAGTLGGQGGQNFQNLYNAAGQPGAAEQYLTNTANGSMLQNNPYIDSIVQKGQDEAGTGVNQMFAQGGRYGGGVNQGTLADSYQTIGNQFRGQEYENERARQMQAAGAISGEQQGRMGIQSGAASGVGNVASALGGLGQNAMGNWMNAQSGAAGLANQGIQNQFGAMGQLGNVQNNKLFDANTISGVGQQATDASQNQLNDLINQWGQGDMSGWARLGGLLSAGTGSAGNYGTGTSTTKNTSQAGLGSILGGILSLAGI